MTEDHKEKKWRSCFRPNLFAGKIALVTGGGTGIGRAIATELASIGATVVIASRNVETCQQAAAAINESLDNECQGRVVVGPSCSIRDEGEVENLVRAYNLPRGEIFLYFRFTLAAHYNVLLSERIPSRNKHLHT